MRIHNLSLQNIGLFKKASLEFIGSDDDYNKPPVIIITGENGTGKTVLIDAIRFILWGKTRRPERDISSSMQFYISSTVSTEIRDFVQLNSNKKDINGRFVLTNSNFDYELNLGKVSDSFIDYWTSKLSNDEFKINTIETINTRNHLENYLTGIHKNIDVIKTICFIDYLKDSKDQKEKELGEMFFLLIDKIFQISLLDGKFEHVSRIELQPVVSINNQLLTLDKLSSASLYFIQRYISLLKQLYVLCVGKGLSINEIQNTKGLLLIDEAENHLHPKWQKKFLDDILSIFPNTQIILTTHSPFIVSSVENSRVYVCSNSSDGSIVKEETDYYRNLPIEEILLSPVFNTNPFNSEITELLRRRKSAIEENNYNLRYRVEQELLKLNPDYFNFFNLDKIIEELKNETPR